MGEFIDLRGFVPLRGYCGHGIDANLMENLKFLNYLEKGASAKSGPKIKNGMVFCIEPMICQKDGTPKHFNGKWGAGSVDELNSAHYEHCVAIINGRAEILSSL